MRTDTDFSAAAGKPSEKPSQFTPRQFSLRKLMLCVVIIGLFLGMVRLTFPREFVATYITIIAGMAAAIALLAFLGKVRLVPLLAVLAVLGVAIGYLLQPATSTWRRLPCDDNLKQIAAALHSYHELHGCLPPPMVADEQGRPMHSWRVLILPHLREQRLYEQYSLAEPWDGPNNRQLHQRFLDIYSCPEEYPDRYGTAPRETGYLVVVGPKTAFPGDKCVALSDITDGKGNTILVVEVLNSGIHWMEPRDLHVTQMARRINPAKGQGISSKHQGGANVLMVDGSVRFLNAEMAAEEIQSLLTIAGKEPAPEERPD